MIIPNILACNGCKCNVWMLDFVAFAIIASATLTNQPMEIAMNKLITREELQQRLSSEDAPTLVEALPEKYFRQGHLPGALHLPHTEVAERAPQLLPDRMAAIVVYCASATCQNS